MDKICQDFIIISCDHAIYDIATAIKEKYPYAYKNFIFRLGDFHVAEHFMGAIGKLTRGAGIEELLVDANVFLKGTMNKIMSGKDYYLMPAAFSLFDSFLFQLRWKSFEK